MGKHIMRMSITGGVGWLIVIIIEFIKLKGFKKIFKCNRNQNNVIVNEEIIDSDVLEEKRLIMKMKEKELSKYNLVIKGLSKSYGHIKAVKDMCVAINR